MIVYRINTFACDFMKLKEKELDKFKDSLSLGVY